MINLVNITKKYITYHWSLSIPPLRKREVHALKGINMKVERGQTVALLGPNGAGKTTILKILATLISFDGGHGSICGYDLQNDAQEIRRIIGLVNTNDRSFYWRLTGRQNLEFFGALYELDSNQIKRKIDGLLEQFDLNDIADRPYMTYSAGQRQRFSLARALLPNPRVLLLDEPTTSLDPVSSMQFIRYIKALSRDNNGEKAILWCTHNLYEAKDVCDFFFIVSHGRVVFQGEMGTEENLAQIFQKIVAGGQGK